MVYKMIRDEEVGVLFIRLKQTAYVLSALLLCAVAGSVFAASQAFIVKAYVAGEIVIGVDSGYPIDDLDLGTISGDGYKTKATNIIPGIRIYDTEASAPQIVVSATTDDYDSGGPFVKLDGVSTPTVNQKIYYELYYVPCDRWPIATYRKALLTPTVASGQKVVITSSDGGITQETCVDNTNDTPGSLVLVRPVIADADRPDAGTYTATVTLTASAT